MKHLDVWKLIEKNLERNEPVVLMTVCETTGSSPGQVGFHMAVTAQNGTAGSVGGGAVEYGLAETARRMLKKTSRRPELFRRAHHDDGSPDSDGMICAGEQSVILTPCFPENLPDVRMILKSLEKEPGYPRILTLSPEGMSVSGPEPDSPLYTFSVGDGTWAYREKTGAPQQVFIFGGGHVSLALCRVLKTLDFHTTVLEDRENIPTFENNEFADVKIHANFGKAGDYLPDGGDIYAVIMTFSHHADETVLRQICRRNFRYLGMMGSPAKVRQIRGNLMNAGIPESVLESLHAPVGLPICSGTPAEIAVSVAAELIQTRNC